MRFLLRHTLVTVPFVCLPLFGTGCVHQQGAQSDQIEAQRLDIWLVNRVDDDYRRDGLDPSRSLKTKYEAQEAAFPCKARRLPSGEMLLWDRRIGDERCAVLLYLLGRVYERSNADKAKSLFESSYYFARLADPNPNGQPFREVADAMYLLSRLYGKDGTGTQAPRSDRRRLYLVEAARSHHLHAQYELSQRYRTGDRGFAKNKELADRWLRSAAYGGHGGARCALAAVAAKAGDLIEQGMWRRAAGSHDTFHYYDDGAHKECQNGEPHLNPDQESEVEHRLSTELRDPFVLGAVGSAFFMGTKKLLTAWHVASEQACNGRPYVPGFGPATMTTDSPSNEIRDLAVLRLAEEANGVTEWLELAKHSTEDVGREVFALGFPRIGLYTLSPHVTDGIVSHESGTYGRDDRFLFTASITGGNSGGPVVRRKAVPHRDGEGIDTALHAIGVVVATAAPRQTRTGLRVPQNLNAAASISEAVLKAAETPNKDANQSYCKTLKCLRKVVVPVECRIPWEGEMHSRRWAIVEKWE